MLLLIFPSKIFDIRIIPEMDYVIWREENNHLASFKAVITILLTILKFSTLYLISFFVFMVLCHKLTICQENRIMFQITIFYLHTRWFAVTCWMMPALTMCLLECLPAPLKNFLIAPSNAGVCTIVLRDVSNKKMYIFIHPHMPIMSQNQKSLCLSLFAHYAHAREWNLSAAQRESVWLGPRAEKSPVQQVTWFYTTFGEKWSTSCQCRKYFRVFVE